VNLRDELLGIYQRRGQLVPEDVVDEARPATSPLHHRFEWDDAEAGEQYRIIQARQLIREVDIKFTSPQSGEVFTLRAFSSLNKAGAIDRDGYAPTEEILMDDTLRAILLQQMQRDISNLRATYGHLEEFATALLQATEPEPPAPTRRRPRKRT